jgi:hypothetical protein
MRNALALLTFMTLLGVPARDSAADQQPPPAAAAGQNIDEIIKAARGDLQSKRAAIIASNVTLTADQATAFWPVFNRYQLEQNSIMEDQMKGLQRYADSYQTLADADAIALINAHFDRDARMAELRRQWFGEFLKVLPVRLAVRVMQLDRRISLTHQIEFASRIPLAQ